MSSEETSTGKRLRALGRLLVWLAISFGLMAAISLAIKIVFHPRGGTFLDPVRLIVGDVVLTLIPTLIGTSIMARIERHSFSDYYIPRRGLIAREFWTGMLWGVLSVSLLVGLIALAGGYKIIGIAAAGRSLVHGFLLWIAASLTIGIVEEFAFRAYMLRTLADSIGFWTAAVLLSIGFGALHYFEKPYERWEDFAATGLLGLFMCFTIRRTGTIAFAVGWHAAFDWGAIYFYSGRNAGEFAPGHLLATSWSGPNWLTGGLLGPEASWFVFVVTALLFVAFALVSRYKGRASQRREQLSHADLNPAGSRQA